MRRRKLLLGLGGLAGASGVVGSGAFSSITANRDVTVSVADDTDAFLALRPSDGPNSAYVKDIADNGGLLALDFSETDEGAKGLGTDSVYTFDNVFTITNQGTQPVYVWGTFDGGSENFTAGGDDTDIWLYPDGDSETKLRDNGDGVVQLGVGDTVHVGVYVDTHDVTSDQTLAMTMTIHADAEKPAGAPGTTKPYPPVRVTTAETKAPRYFHTLPPAAKYASGKKDIRIKIEEGSYPRANLTLQFIDPIDNRNWAEYVIGGRDEKVVFTGSQNEDYEIRIGLDRSNQTGESWSATIEKKDFQTKTVGLSTLLNASVTDDGLTFAGTDITYPGGSAQDSFVFNNDANDNETLSFYSPSSGSGTITRLTLADSESSVSFTDTGTFEASPRLLSSDGQQLSISVPDKLKLQGRKTNTSVGHSLILDAGSGEKSIRVHDLSFDGPPEYDSEQEITESVGITSSGNGTITNLKFENVEFDAIDGSSRNVAGIGIKPAVDDVAGMSIRNCSFRGRGTGLLVSGDPLAEITRLRIAWTIFKNNGSGINVGDITEGYVTDSKFVDNTDGFLLDDPEALGLERVDFKRHSAFSFIEGVAFGFSGSVAEIDLEADEKLADVIESDIDGDRGKSGIIDSTFVDNEINVESIGNNPSDDYPVSGCTFSPERGGDDIDEY